MTRYLVTGGGGQLAGELAGLLAARPDAEVRRPARDELDITDERAVRAAVSGADVVLNTAAWTDVDGAETAEEAAAAVNAVAPGHLARACADSGAVLVHVSTDYVFDGTADRPYRTDDPVRPRSAYGRTKAAGEAAVLAAGGQAYVVRTAWVYGAHGRNFVTTMAGLAGRRPTVDVVDDQRGSPTWTRDLGSGLLALAGSGAAPGIYHLTGGGQTTWYGLARAVFAAIGADPDRVHPTTSAAFPRPAPRPAYSVLDGSCWTAAGLPAPRPWADALTAFVAGAPAGLLGPPAP